MSFFFRRKLLIPFILLSYISFSLCANVPLAPSLRGVELSKKIEADLQKTQFSPQKMPLSATGTDDFAYNLFLDLSTNYSNEVQNAKTLIFCIKQSDFYQQEEKFIRFLKDIGSSNLLFPVQFVFTALDEQNSILEGYNQNLEGTKNFAQTLDESSDSFVIILDFKESPYLNKAKIFTTGGKKSTPLELTKEVIEAFYKTGEDFITAQKILSLYRAGLLEGDEQMAYFFNNSIPCIKISLPQDDSLSAIKHFIKNHDFSKKIQNDVNYFFFAPKLNFFERAFWFNERFNIISLEIFGITVLLFLVCFTFSGKTRVKTKKVFSRFWFLLPVFLFLSMLSLYVSQVLCLAIKPVGYANPVSQFALKIIFSSVFVAILFLLQTKLKLPTNTFLYGFMLTITAISNVFIFSTVDITLFWTFALEYLIVYFSRNLYRVRTLVFSAFLMLLPFLPYVVAYFSNVDDKTIRFFIDANFSTNLLLCLILFPFQIMWLRVLLRLRTTKLKGKDFKTLATYTFVSLLITLFTVFTFAYLATKFVFYKKHTPKQTVSYIQGSDKNLSIAETSKSLAQISSDSLSIFSKEQALRYSVTVTSKKATPILDSLYDFWVTDNSRTAIFTLPDYPPKEITIDFSTEKNTEKLFTITAIYETGKPGVFKKEIISKVFTTENETP